MIFFAEEKNPVLLAFSAYTNGKKLFKCKPSTSPSVISCFDGIRAISALWIVSTHFTYHADLFIINPEPTGTVTHILRNIFLCGPFGVDSFFVITAILAAKKMLHEISKLVIDFEIHPQVILFKICVIKSN